MKRQTYSMDSIRRSLSLFEDRYGMSSEEFYSAYQSDGPEIAAIPGFDRRVWESLYLEALQDGPPVSLPTDTGELTPA